MALSSRRETEMHFHSTRTFVCRYAWDVFVIVQSSTWSVPFPITPDSPFLPRPSSSPLLLLAPLAAAVVVVDDYVVAVLLLLIIILNPSQNPPLPLTSLAN